MKKHIALLILIFISLVNSSVTYSEELPIQTFGYGLHKCEEVSKVIDSNIEKHLNAYKIWIAGYLSSYSSFVSYGGRKLVNLKPSTVLSDIYSYCKKEPNVYLGEILTEIAGKYIEKNTVVVPSAKNYMKEYCELAEMRKTKGRL